MDRESFQSSPDDALDAMLAQARWPEPSGESTHQLLAEWRTISPRRWRAFVPMSAAAAILLAAGVAIGIFSTRPVGVGVAVRPVSPPTIAQPLAEPAFPVESIPVRAPNSIETMLIEAKRPVRKTKPPAPPAAIRLAADDWVKRAEAVQSDGELDALVKRISTRQTLAPRFAQIAAVSEGNHRIAAVKLLARCADADLLPTLLAFYNDASMHDAALPGVERLADATVLGWLIRDERHRADQPAFVAELLRRDPDMSVPIYLALIKQGIISSSTAVPRDIPPATMNALFAELNDSRQETRQAAARALGQIDGPITTARLVEMAEQGTNRREALMALAYSNGPEARQYLARAEAAGPLRSSVRTILSQIKP